MEKELINFAEIERKWQKIWDEKKAFVVDEASGKEKLYVLEMFPYPSGSGLHMGHALNYSIGDIYARLKRMQGFSVLYPMGYDSFGLPAENAAIQEGTHPAKYTEKTVSRFVEQQKKLGLSYDWNRMFCTSDADYYKWNQYFFLQFLEKGLAYRKKSNVNWCPECNTVLANEQVHSGKCWRHEDTDVIVKPLEQWFLKTTNYAEELLEKIEDLEWPERIKAMQRNWIGKSEGSEVAFEIANKRSEKFKILIGTRNGAKISMMKNAFANYSGIEFLSLEDFPDLDDSELKEGEDFKENARMKSEFYFKKTGIPTISTDQIQWIEKYPKDDGFIVHIRKLVNPNSPRASDEEVGKWIESFVEKNGESKSNFYYAISYTDENGTKDFVNIQKEYTLQKERSEKSNEGYVFDRYMKDPITGEFRIEQPESISFGKLHDFVNEEFVPQALPEFKKWNVFTTRVDTLFGVTFLVVSAQHPELDSLVVDSEKENVAAFLKKIKSTKQEDMDTLEKEGVFTGSYAMHPLTGEKIPIWAGNFVVADYGSGMVMGVPAHDQRDYDFAKKYGLEIKQVVRPVLGKPVDEAEFRNTISAVVHRKKDDTFLLLKWHGFGWISPSIGGVEDGESIEEAAEREVLEETGYKTKFVKKLGEPIESHFYAENKKTWRHRIDQPILLELVEEEPVEVSEDEKKKHGVVWMSSREALDKISHEQNKWGIMRYLGIEEAYTGYGVLVNSEGFDGLKSEEAKEHIVNALASKEKGKKTINYKLRDWLVSRQRYWGTPIPVIYCNDCGIVPVSEKDLPVVLPENVTFGEGNPLLSNTDFVNVDCPKCGSPAKRETDTMDTFFDSSWYYLRYLDSHNNETPFDKAIAAKWMPVDQYIGGAEHACMHLIYARFFTKALRDLGFVSIDEPFTKLFNQGMLHGEDGNKMSKSLGNVIDPLEMIAKYSADVLRMGLVSFGSPNKNMNWDQKLLDGSLRFVMNVIEFANGFERSTMNALQESKFNRLIKEYSADLESFKYNMAVIKLRELFDVLKAGSSTEDVKVFLKLLSPVCPHVAEELWSKIVGENATLVSLSEWPCADESKINEKLEEEAQQVEKTVADVKNILSIMHDKGKEGENIYMYVLPQEKERYVNAGLAGKIGKNVKVFAVNDAEKYDPEGKSSKVKPGRPGIYIE